MFPIPTYSKRFPHLFWPQSISCLRVFGVIDYRKNLLCRKYPTYVPTYFRQSLLTDVLSAECCFPYTYYDYFHLLLWDFCPYATYYYFDLLLLFFAVGCNFALITISDEMSLHSTSLPSKVVDVIGPSPMCCCGYRRFPPILLPVWHQNWCYRGTWEAVAPHNFTERLFGTYSFMHCWHFYNLHGLF